MCIFRRSEGFPEEVATELRSKEKVELVEQREEEKTQLIERTNVQGPVA